MEEKKWEDYINEVLSFVKFKYDHKTIRRELAEHMKDMQEDLMAEGMDEAAAEYMTVAYMGDAAEIGRALNEEHSPLLGWIWHLAKGLVLVAFLGTFMTLLYLGDSVVSPLYSDYREITDSPVVFTVEKKFKSYDDTLILDGTKLHEDGTLDIRYRVKRNPFVKSILVFRDVDSIILDEAGKNMHIGTGGFQSNFVSGSKGQRICFVPKEAETLVLYWGELILQIDLDTGEVAKG